MFKESDTPNDTFEDDEYMEPTVDTDPLDTSSSVPNYLNRIIKHEEVDCSKNNDSLLDSEWSDVVKMNDYLTRGRRPQFWEEPFTKRV